MRAVKTFDINEMRARYIYDPSTGLIYPRKIKHPSKAGMPIGTLSVTGYIRICINGPSIPAHRLAWALHYGVWPSGVIDHINGVKEDYKIAN